MGDESPARTRPPTFSDFITDITVLVALLFIFEQAENQNDIVSCESMLLKLLPETLNPPEFRNMSLVDSAYIIEKEVLKTKYQVFIRNIMIDFISEC